MENILGQGTISNTQNKKYKFVGIPGYYRKLKELKEKPLKLCDHVMISSLTKDNSFSSHESMYILVCCNTCEKQFNIDMILEDKNEF